jgi:hypothetical protein
LPDYFFWETSRRRWLTFLLPEVLEDLQFHPPARQQLQGIVARELAAALPLGVGVKLR